MWNLLRKSWSAVSEKLLILVVLNWVFFGSMVAGALVGTIEPVSVLSPRDENVFHEEGWGFPLVLEIFIFNLIVSGVVFVTLPGFLFFALPAVLLSFRALLWGALLNRLSTSLFFAALPTLVLEGEGYVLAAVAGISVGLSWLKPRWMYKEEKLSRFEAAKKALKECVYIYVLVAIFLLAAATAETITVSTLG